MQLEKDVKRFENKITQLGTCYDSYECFGT